MPGQITKADAIEAIRSGTPAWIVVDRIPVNLFISGGSEGPHCIAARTFSKMLRDGLLIVTDQPLWGSDTREVRIPEGVSQSPQPPEI